MAGIDDRIDFLASSPHRVDVLQTLARQEPLSRRAIRDRVEASRSTVKRTLDGLTDLDWVVRTDEGYRITPVGSAVLAAYREFADVLRTAESVSPVFRWLPGADVDFDLGRLDDADVVVASDGDPYAPAVCQAELLERASRFRGLLPSIDRDCTRIVNRRIDDGNLEAELVVSTDVAEIVHEEPYGGLVTELLSTGRLTVSVVDRLPYYLGLADDGTVQLCVEDDDGLPRALLETDNDAVRQWAERRYEQHRTRADPLGSDAFD